MGAVVVSPKVPDSLSFVAFEDDLCLSFTRKHLLRGGSVELAADMVQWEAAKAQDTLDPGLALLGRAILSLSVTFFGTQNRQRLITNRGYGLYGEVLKQLNSHLAQPQLQTTNETILTALTCMLLEVFLPTGPNHFLKHVRGIEAIVAARGPPAPLTGHSASIFHNLRMLSIIGGLAQARASIWARPEWKRVPPLYTDEGALIRYDMFQLLADCTVQLSERDRIKSISQDTKDLHPILIAANTSLERLKSILPRWERYDENLASGRTTSMRKDFRISNHASATTFMLYNAAYMCILRVINSIEPSPKHASLRNSAAIKIVRCLEQKGFDKREGGSESNTIAFVATKIAWEALGGFSSPEGRKLARIVKSAANGTFAIGAWEYKPEKTHLVNPQLTDKTLVDLWNQPMWAEHHLVDKPVSDLLSRREIINVGERPTAQWSSPLLPHRIANPSIPFTHSGAITPSVHMHETMEENQRSTEALPSFQHTAQSEIFDQSLTTF